jgi:predicted GH43/DUF377 family glycosyl hydrolase
LEEGVYGAIPDTVIKDGSEYKMWYQLGWQINYATSKDGKTWTKIAGSGQLGAVLQGKPTWSSTGEERFDNYLIQSCRVIKDGNTYKMWYMGNIMGGIWRIGYAYSNDGINWNRVDGKEYLKSVISYEKQNDESYANIESFHVIKDGETYKIWYIVYKNVGSPIKQIRTFYYATSNDGTAWETLNKKDYDVRVSNNLDTFIGGEMSIIKEDSKYYMFYSGSYFSSQGIGYAYSEDGTNWNQIKGSYKYGAVFVNNTKAFDRDGVIFPCVIKDGNEYKMWYVGLMGEMDPQSHLWTDLKIRIGLATAPTIPQQNNIPGFPEISVFIGLILISYTFLRARDRARTGVGLRASSWREDSRAGDAPQS